MPNSQTQSGLPTINLKAMPSVLARLNRLALRYPWRFSFAIACALASAILGLVTPRLVGEAVNHAQQLLAQSQPLQTTTDVKSALYFSGFLIVIAASLRGIFTGLQGYLGENIAQRVGYDLRLVFFEKLQHLDFSFHDKSHSGDLIARGMLDLEGVRAFLEMGVLRTIMLFLLLSVGTWRLLSVDLVLGCLALSFVPFVLLRASTMGFRLRRTWMRLQELMSDMTLRMEENLQGVRVVRAFSSQAYEEQHFDKISADALEVSKQRITTRVLSMSTMNLAFYTAMGLVLWIGGKQVAAGTLSIGTLTEFLTFMTILQQPVRQVGMIVNSSARATSAGARLFEIIDAQPAIKDAEDANPLNISDGILEFNNVSFTYPGLKNSDEYHHKHVINNISFTLKKGRTLAFVGAPGSGKSTIVQLIPRFYDVDSGSITIDGQDVRKVTLDSLRNAVGLVQQDVFLFDTSAYKNIAYADPLIDDERVTEAAQTAHIHEHLDSLDNGYETRVGERGQSLSGGQRQRMSIARSLATNPHTLILDDSTSAIDATTEHQLVNSLKATAATRSTIIIAHRLSSVKDADEIIFISNGRITEQGNHQTLIAQNGDYAKLWKLQQTEAHTI
jgi:ATP-binding cassette, subfamily B, multidrug efflux pump